MGRRIRKRVETYNGSSWPETSDELFVYDGWNIVMVINANASDVNATAAITRKYTWGLDLSGTIHGAGGIGGLLAAVETQGTTTETDDQRYWFMYDANGNVGQVLDATSLQSIGIGARYEYDPYGNPIPIPQAPGPGPYADLNPFRFSTKCFDDETDLGYWGHRYYSPRLGRWISRDPIGEEGGLNLILFVSNSPLIFTDPLGLEEMGTHWHHLLPDEFAGLFNEAGIGPDLRNSAEYGWEIPAGAHVGANGIHPDWNQDWDDWFDDMTRKGKKVTKEMVDKHLNEMLGSEKYKPFLDLGNRATMSYGEWDKTMKALAKARRWRRLGARMRKVGVFTKRVGKKVPVVGLVFCGFNIYEKGVVRGVADTALDQAPFIGWGKGIYELVTGEDLIPPPSTSPSP